MFVLLAVALQSAPSVKTAVWQTAPEPLIRAIIHYWIVSQLGNTESWHDTNKTEALSVLIRVQHPHC